MTDEPRTVAEHLTTPEERLAIARDILQRCVDINDGDGQVLASIVLQQIRADMAQESDSGSKPRVFTDEMRARSGRGVLFDDQMTAVQQAKAALERTDAPLTNHLVARASAALREALQKHERVVRADQQMEALLGFAADQDIELDEGQRTRIYDALLDEGF